MINVNDFKKISMNGRMAYIILCIEKYLLSMYPDTDWSILSDRMWSVTNSYWDEWDDMFIEIIPEYLFEFDTYDDSNFEILSREDYNYFCELLRDRDSSLNNLLLKLHDLQTIYCYTYIKGDGTEASEIVISASKILADNNIDLPDINAVSFSSFSEKNGWGEMFDGTSLSLILN